MTDVMTPIRPNDPRQIAWKKYQTTESYTNAKKWALAVVYDDGRVISDEVQEHHVEGSLWAAFVAGFEAGSERTVLVKTPSPFVLSED